MDAAISLVLTAAWLAFGVLLAYGVLDAWWHPEPLPLFRMLGRHGLAAARVEEAAGREAFSAALRRCELCADRKTCARALAVDWLGRGPLACRPNAGFFRQLKAGEAPRA